MNFEGTEEVNSFVKGTIFLMLVIFISKLLGFVFRMQFMRIAGEEVVGLYMTSYPTFIFFISLIQLGIPIATSKLVAGYFAKGQYAQIEAVYRGTFRLSVVAILLFIPLLALCTPFIATALLHNEKIIGTLLVGLAAVPFVIIASLYKAYLQGITQITPTAWAQLLEQCIRIGLTMTLLPLFISPNEPAQTAAYAMGITLMGELFSLLFLRFYVKRMKRKLHAEQVVQVSMKPVFTIALPAAGSKLFGSFTWFLEPIIFLKALTVAGLTASYATTLYGVISGVHIPLLLFPAFIPAALAIVLIPAVSDAVARHNTTLLNNRIELSLRLSSLVGCVAATIFYLHGDELAMQLFHLEENRGYMKILAPIFYFYYIQSPLHSILQAIDEGRVAMLNSMYGGIGKLFILFVLASQPFIQERGAIIAIGFGVLITSFLHIASIRQHKQIAVGFRIFLMPYLLFILMCIIQPLLTRHMSLLIEITMSVIFLTFLLVITKQLRLSDLRIVRSIFSRL